MREPNIQSMLHIIAVALVLSLLIVSDDTNLELQLPATWRILSHLEDTAENLSLLEAVVVLQTDPGLLPVCLAAWGCREPHLETKKFLSVMSIKRTFLPLYGSD